MYNIRYRYSYIVHTINDSNYADNIVNIGKMVINFNVYTVKIVLVGSSNIVIKNDSLVPKRRKWAATPDVPDGFFPVMHSVWVRD